MASNSISSSSSYPVQTAQNAWQLQLSQLISQIGQQQVQQAMGMYNNASAVTDAEINNFNQQAATGENNASQFMNEYTNQIQPEITAQIADANSYASTPRIQENMGAAESATGQAANAGRINAEDTLRGYGIDPSSGRYQELEQAQRAGAAAAQAGAGQQAELTTENTGRNLRQQAITTGQNLPGFAANSLNSAINATSGASQSGLGLANAGANLIQAPTGYFNAANRINNPPMASNSFSSSSNGGGESSSSGSGGGNGGGGGGSGPVDDPVAAADTTGIYSPGMAQDDPGYVNSAWIGDGYAAGGGVLPSPTTGGHVPMQASPSMGQNTDDVSARLNAGEFVVPRDVAAWKGQEFFQKLIEESRRKRLGAPAKGKPKPSLGGPPRFASRPMQQPPQQMGAQ